MSVAEKGASGITRKSIAPRLSAPGDFGHEHLEGIYRLLLSRLQRSGAGDRRSGLGFRILLSCSEVAGPGARRWRNAKGEIRTLTVLLPPS
jgi:hypothetical protein